MLNIIDAGLMEYEASLNLQEQLMHARLKNKIPDTLILLEHPPTITIGRSGKKTNILVAEEILQDKGIKVYEVNRGGDVTFHGPGQLVGYPIIDLNYRGRDILNFYGKLEQVIINILQGYSIGAYKNPKYPGVWVGDGKIAAIGIAVKKWITMHGFALNIDTQQTYFQLINPCGVSKMKVTSIQECCPGAYDKKAVRTNIINQFSELFNLKPVNIFERCSC